MYATALGTGGAPAYTATGCAGLLGVWVGEYQVLQVREDGITSLFSPEKGTLNVTVVYDDCSFAANRYYNLPNGRHVTEVVGQTRGTTVRMAEVVPWSREWGEMEAEFSHGALELTYFGAPSEAVKSAIAFTTTMYKQAD